ncbi:MAG: 3'(2'),5'-bisphosphate nucleotidase CysQ [Caldilineaceae bacterium]|nr:3'(2'),5'-bisphosphate nucleotidase CysQ [Caldilineaceae bacterium]
MTERLDTTLDLTAEYEFACKLAREAATIVTTFYVGSSEVEYKSHDEPVTEADRSANQHIVTRISEMYPDDGILSEESKDDLIRLEKRRVWIVDPLDGTKEFIARNGEFSIMIGLAIDGLAVMGVIMQPDPGILYAGGVGIGAFLYENENEPVPIHVSDQQFVNRMTLVSSRSHRQQIVDRVRATLRITRERVSGSVGLKVGLIARRLSDVYIHPSPGCKEWDLCAPCALLEAAGGVMTDCWGNPLVFNKRDVRAHNGVVATNAQNHDQIVQAVAHVCEEFGYNEDDGFW